MTTETQVAKFEVGQTYFMRSICDYNCVWTYTVAARTASTIKTTCGLTLRINKKLTEWNKAEAVKPLGVYSMSPTLTADRIGTGK